MAKWGQWFGQLYWFYTQKLLSLSRVRQIKKGKERRRKVICTALDASSSAHYSNKENMSGEKELHSCRLRANIWRQMDREGSIQTRIPNAFLPDKEEKKKRDKSFPLVRVTIHYDISRPFDSLCTTFSPLCGNIKRKCCDDNQLGENHALRLPWLNVISSSSWWHKSNVKGKEIEM